MLGVRRKTTLIRWVIGLAWRVLKYGWVITFGMPRPKRDKRRAPHEYLDLLRPEVSAVGKLIQGFLFIAVALWILRIQSYVVPSHTNTLQSLVLDHLNFTDPWWGAVLTFPLTVVSWLTFPLLALPWTMTLLLIPLAVVFYHRGVFRALLIFTNEPYTDDRKFYTKQLRNGVRAKGPELVMVVSLAAGMFLDLIQHVGNPLDHPILNTLAFIAVIVSLGSALWAGIKLARWYINDVRERYAALEEFQIESIHELPDHVHDLPKLQANLTRLFELRNLSALQRYAESIGYTVTDYDITLLKRTAILTPVNEGEYSIYKSAERNLGKPIYEFDIEFEWATEVRADIDQYSERLESYKFLRAPVGGTIPEKRVPAWQAMFAATPGWGDWCSVDDTNDNPIKTLRWRAPPALPDIFLTRSILPSTYPSRLEILKNRIWARPVQGVSAHGRAVSVNLTNVPHMLIAGGTNSGKSSTILNDMVYRRACGHQLALFDNSSKKGGTFLNLKEHTFMFCTSPSESANGLAMLAAETSRRSRFLMENYRVNDWLLVDDFEGLIAAGILPTTAYYDEYETSISTDKERKYLDADDPKRIMVENRNRAIDEIEGYVLGLAREARAVGIFLYIATQKPLAGKIGTSLRDQLGNTLQLAAGKMTSSNVALTMGSETEKAMEEFKKFHRPKLDKLGAEMRDDSDQVIMMPGLGVLLADGSEPTALRMAYLKPEDAPVMLRELGVPEAEPWDIVDTLELGMAEDTSRFIDVKDTRPRIKPPFPDTGASSSAPSSSSVSVLEKQADASSLLKELFRKS